MAGEKEEFRISFRNLLSDVTQALKWPEPIYNQGNLAMHAAHLVLLRNPGPNAAFFRGEAAKTLAESEEHAAEQAVDFLVQKKQVIIEDINLDRRNKYKACCQFFKDKREALECLDQPACRATLGGSQRKKVTVPSTLPKIIVADLWSVWLQVAAAYKVTADDVEFVTQASGTYVCCFTVTWPNNASKERYFIGEICDTIANAKQSLVKKTIRYFQSIYGFSVKDANFNRMKYSQLQCGFQRRRYLCAREEHNCQPSDLHSVPLYISDGCQTPEGTAFGIRSGLSMPPAPKKQKSIGEGQVSGAALQNAAAFASVTQSSEVAKNPFKPTIY